MHRLLAHTLIAVILLALLAPAVALADRAPSASERAAILDVFNIPGRSFSGKCVRIRVSTVNPRYAILTSPRRIPPACLRAGEVGDGFVFFRRATASSNRWRNIYEGSERPPCKVPPAVRDDLTGITACF